MKKIVGIIGGMGPLATIDLMQKITFFTSAIKDQDHIHIIADSDSQIPDRTSAILGKGSDPLPLMIQSAQRLQNAGADFLVIACNTAHFFYEKVQMSVQIPIVHMPRETALFINENKYKKVGLLATDGTVLTKIYQNNCYFYGTNVIVPNKSMQERVMEGIYAIKAGNLVLGFEYLTLATETLYQQGAEAIIAGCTEIPLVLKSTEKISVIDPTEIVARTIIKIVNESNKHLATR